MAAVVGDRGRRFRLVRIPLTMLRNGVLVVVLAYSLSFFLLFMLPGDAVLARIGLDGNSAVADLDPEAMSRIRDDIGLDRPLGVIFLTGLLGIFRGDLGTSLINGRPVTDLIAEALPNTAQLAALSLGLSVIIGLGLAFLAVVPRARWVRALVAQVPVAYSSLPVFWVGLIAIYVFSIQLGLLPSSGSRTPDAVILPAVVLSLGGAAQFAQVLIASLEEELSLTYASTTAPAKGASRARVVFAHVLRNAAFAFLTVLGLRIAWLLGGTVIIETVFSRTGIGRLMVDSVRSVDLTVVLGIVVLSAVLYVVVNIGVDIGYWLLDPRLRRSAPASPFGTLDVPGPSAEDGPVSPEAEPWVAVTKAKR